MASRIQRFMNDLGFQRESMAAPIYNKIAYFLKGFDTLVVCSRVLGEDERLTPLLTRIDQAFARNAEIVELHGRGGFQGEISADLIHDFGADLKSFEIEIDEWYTTLSNPPHSRSPTLIGVIEIIDSVLGDLQNFHCLEFSDAGDDSEGMEEKLQLFRNFVEFVEMFNVEQEQQLELEGFVVQVAGVALNAAHVCSRLYGLFDTWNVQGWSQVKHGWKLIQPQILALLKRIKPMSVEVSQTYKTAMSISKSTEELRYSMDLDPAHYSLVMVIKSFIDFLLWCLWETLEMDFCVDDDSVKDQVRPLWGGLKFLRAHADGFKEVEEFRMTICDAGLVIFSSHYPESGIAGLVENFEMTVAQVKEQREGLEFSHSHRVQETSMELSSLPGTGNELLPPSSLCKVAGITDEEVTIITNELTTGWEMRLMVVPIAGMAGLGKTTFARKVYNHSTVCLHFQVRAWCTVSQVFNKRAMLLQLLSQIQQSLTGDYLDMCEEDLVYRLQQSLRGRRYLVFLDDVWDSKLFISIRDEWLPDDSTGSRILTTSRDMDITLGLRGYVPYILRLRTDYEIFEILKTTLFPGDDFPETLLEIGMQIAERCKGLPMTIAAVARLLTTPNTDVWKKVLESLRSNAFSITEQFMVSIESSYKRLPDHLKLCFLSFRLFSEEEEVSAKWLYLMWIAEGFIHEVQYSYIEDAAADCMKDLVNKSLVIVTKRGPLGGIKTCRVHEAIHAFCIRKAEEENFSHILQGYDDILAVNELSGSQRLCIQSSRRDFKTLRLSRPNIHSLLFLPLKDTWPRVADDVSFITHVFKTLRVLHIRHIDLGEVFPAEMKLLVELRYLAVRGHFVDIPSSIGNLSNLQTLIVDAHMEIALPGTIWDLHELRHLCIKNGCQFHLDNLDDSSVLSQLKSCSVVIAESWDICERLMKRFPNVAKLKLKCRLLDSIGGVVLQHCHRFEVASHLERLTLKDLELSESGISAVGKLPRLESLRLLHVSFSGGGLHMEEGHFQRLRYFKLSDSNITRWTTAKDYYLRNLRKLVLQGCACLEEIPYCLEKNYGIEEIELFNCSPLVESLVRHVEQVQREDYGNSVSVSITPSS